MTDDSFSIKRFLLNPAVILAVASAVAWLAYYHHGTCQAVIFYPGLVILPLGLLLKIATNIGVATSRLEHMATINSISNEQY